jgi:hypothetical protein
MRAPVYHARVTTNNMLLIPLGFVYCDLILTSRIFAAKTFSQIHYQIKSNPLSNQIHYQVKSIIKSNPLSSQIHYQIKFIIKSKPLSSQIHYQKP